jgi:hypothetical protein
MYGSHLRPSRKERNDQINIKLTDLTELSQNEGAGFAKTIA